MGRIVVVGSINLDLVASVARMPRVGETVHGAGFATFPGGKGANQAVAAARLGGDVAMVGRVGSDGFAATLHGALGDYGVKTDAVASVEGPSGCAVILVNAAGENSIVVIGGANARLLPEDLAAHAGLLRGAAVVLTQLETPLETVEALARMTQEAGVPLILDPAPAQTLSAAVLRCVTWLTPNESETRMLLSLPADATLEPPEAAGRLLETGVRNVILKLGAKGVFVSGADVESAFVEGYRVDAVDTTAAGDAFNGAFAFGLAKGMEALAAARFANAAAAMSVTRPGAQPSMPALDEVERLMNG